MTEDDRHRDEPEGHRGELTVRLDGGGPRTARGALVARFDPLAGAVVWTGRIALELPAGSEVEVTTPHGTARARATEHDVWGGTRLEGIGRPPFAVELLDTGDDVPH